MGLFPYSSYTSSRTSFRVEANTGKIEGGANTHRMDDQAPRFLEIDVKSGGEKTFSVIGFTGVVFLGASVSLVWIGTAGASAGVLGMGAAGILLMTVGFGLGRWLDVRYLMDIQERELLYVRRFRDKISTKKVCDFSQIKDVVQTYYTRGSTGNRERLYGLDLVLDSGPITVLSPEPYAQEECVRKKRQIEEILELKRPAKSGHNSLGGGI